MKKKIEKTIKNPWSIGKNVTNIIFEYVDEHDLRNLSVTCKFFKEVALINAKKRANLNLDENISFKACFQLKKLLAPTQIHTGQNFFEYHKYYEPLKLFNEVAHNVSDWNAFLKLGHYEKDRKPAIYICFGIQKEKDLEVYERIIYINSDKTLNISPITEKNNDNFVPSLVFDRRLNTVVDCEIPIDGHELKNNYKKWVDYFKQSSKVDSLHDLLSKIKYKSKDNRKTILNGCNAINSENKHYSCHIF